MTHSAMVSVLIPCFNAARWLMESVDSALRQSHQNIEVIIVDDGSTDGSIESLGALASDHRVLVVRQANAGQAAALNKAISLSRGEYIQYLDADDVLDSRKIEVQLARLIERSGAVSTSRWARFHGTTANATFVPEFCWQDTEPRKWLASAWHDGGGMMFPALWLLPRHVVECAGPWNESLTVNVDGEYFVRILTQCDRVLFSHDAICYYRSGLQGSVSGRRDPRSWQSYYRSIELIQQHLGTTVDADLRDGLSMVWQRFAVAAWPYRPDLAESAVARGAELSTRKLAIEGGWRMKALASMVGIRTARRIQVLFGRL